MTDKTAAVLVATPCYAGLLHSNYVASLMSLQAHFLGDGKRLDCMFRDDSFLPRGRNFCASWMLAQREFSHLVFIDADIGFEVSSVTRAVGSGHDVVGGIPPLKMDTPAFTVTRAQLSEEDGNGFAETRQIGAGFLCIRATALARLADERPDLAYKPDPRFDARAPEERIVCYRFFESALDDDGTYLTEDYGFCRLWRSIGGAVHVDLLSQFTHRGMKTFTASFGDS